MCGIGFVTFQDVVHHNLLEMMIKETEKRGQDAFGIVRISENGTIRTFKKALPAKKALSTREWKDFIRRIQPGDALIWNCRAQPLTEITSTSFNEHSIQPIIRNFFVVSHNGVVANDKELIEEYNLKTITGIDSEVPLLLHTDANFTLEETFERCSGGFAYLMYDIRRRKLILIKDFKTLVYGHVEGVSFVLSEESFAENVFGRNTFPSWKQMKPYSKVVFDLDENTFSAPTSIKTKIISSLPSQEERVLVCASGGIDSTTAAYVCKRLYELDVILCHIDHGQKSEPGEKKAVENISKALGAEAIFININDLGKLGSSVLTDGSLEVPKAMHQNLKSTVCWTPARNLVMIAMLAAVAEAKGAKYITAGWTLEEEGSYPDNSILFFSKYNELLDYGTLTRPKLIMPLERLMKTEIIQLGNYLEVPYELTYSCDNKPVQGKACGICGACTLRRMAFEKAGVKDKTKYIGKFTDFYTPPWMYDAVRPPKRTMMEILKRLVSPSSYVEEQEEIRGDEC